MKPMMIDIHVIILAAGLSRRMGDVNKLLLEVDKVPMVRRTVELYTSLFKSVSLVTGHEAEKIEQAISGLNIQTLHNPDYAQGQLSSVRCGLMHRPQDYDAVLIALADQPFLTAQDISDYAQSYLASSRDKIFIPYYQAQRGNPVICPASLIHRAKGDDGINLRHFIDNHPAFTYHYTVSNMHFTADIDTPQEARNLASSKLVDI